MIWKVIEYLNNILPDDVNLKEFMEDVIFPVL